MIMKKPSFFAKLFFTAVLVFFASIEVNSQVTIGSSNPPSDFSLLDLDASEQQRGLHNARLTTAQRDALVTPDSPQPDKDLAVGLMIYNTDNDCLEFWNGSQWVSLCFGRAIPNEPDPDLPIAPSSFCLSGYTCFDVAQSHSDTNFASDIVNLANRTFTLSGDGAIDIRFFVTRNDYNAIASLNQNGNTVEIVFRSDINAVMTGNEGVFTILAQFTNGTGGERVQTSITARIQDSACCMVRSTFCQGWLTFMCHNLGADTSLSIDDQINSNITSVTDPTIWGSLFQWGRQADGHQNRTSPSFAEPTIANALPVSDASAFDANGQILDTHLAFGQFIRNNATVAIAQGDWRLPQIDTLWNSGTEAVPVKAINDPCPPGWRVPTIDEWRSIMNGDATAVSDGTTTISGNTWTLAQNGYLIRPNNGTAGEPTLFLPITDWRHRNTANLQNATLGWYWSSTVSGTNVSTIYFAGPGFTVSSFNATRATGHAVRCVAE